MSKKLSSGTDAHKDSQYFFVSTPVLVRQYSSTYEEVLEQYRGSPKRGYMRNLRHIGEKRVLPMWLGINQFLRLAYVSFE